MKPFLKFLSHPITLIVLFAICIRIAYFVQDTRPSLHPDSYGYYSRAVKLRTGNPFLILFSDERVPLYPLIIAAVSKPTELLVQGPTLPSFPNDTTLLLVNAIAGVGTVTIVLLILRTLNVPTYLLILIGCVIATNGALLYWERTILPESIATFFLTAFAYVNIVLIKKQTSFLILLLGFLSITLFLLKPVFIALPCIVFLFLLLTKTTKKYTLLIICSIIVYVGIIFGYIQGNKYFHSYGGINHASDINLLGRIMQFNLPLDEGKDFPYFVDKLTEYRLLNKEPMPYRFLEWSNEEIYGTGWLLEDLRSFTNTIVRHNLPIYIPLALPDVIPALTTFDIPNDVFVQHYPFIFTLLLQISFFIRYSSLFLIFFFPLYIIAWIINISKHTRQYFRYAQLLILAGISMYMVLTAALGSYDNFGRLTTPVFPVTMITIGIGIMDLVKYFLKKKT